MSPQISNFFSSFFTEVATKGGDLVIAASKHTGIFVSFFDIGNTITNILGGLFK